MSESFVAFSGAIRATGRTGILAYYGTKQEAETAIADHWPTGTVALGRTALKRIYGGTK